MTLTLLGAMIGVLGAAAASRVIAAMLFGVSRIDPLSYLGTIVLLAFISLMACAVPAWRAARIDPTVAVRYE